MYEDVRRARGVVIEALHGDRSPEAEAAEQTWKALKAAVNDVVRECVPGREVVAREWERDLAFAMGVGVSGCVPILDDGGFVDAAAPSESLR